MFSGGDRRTRPVARMQGGMSVLPRRFVRPALLLLILGGLWALAAKSGVAEGLTAARVQEWVTGAGPLGVVLFFVAFSAGNLAQIPGVIFIVAARLAFGPSVGLLVAYVGSLVAVSFTFAFVRAVGGKPLGELTFGPARRALARLEEHPVRTIAVLRTVLLLAPPLNCALALTPVRHRDHLLGSALGLVVPVAVVVFLSEFALTLVRSFL